MQIIKYDLLQGVGSAGEPILVSVSLGYSEANLAIAQKEAYNGTYTIEDDGQPEPASQSTVWDELDAAYQAGYDDGYMEGVNKADDQ